jgi:hypothetical protein
VFRLQLLFELSHRHFVCFIGHILEIANCEYVDGRVLPRISKQSFVNSTVHLFRLSVDFLTRLT